MSRALRDRKSQASRPAGSPVRVDTQDFPPIPVELHMVPARLAAPLVPVQLNWRQRGPGVRDH